MKNPLSCKTLKPQHIEIIIDTREQEPLDLEPFRCFRGTLSTGDYSIKGLSHRVAVERKSVQDLVGCVGKDRERFEKEIQRLLSYEVRGIFVEGSLSTIELKQYRGEVHPNAVIGSVMGWMARGIPIMFSIDRATSALMLKRYLFVAAQRYWREAQPFIESLAESDKI